MRRLMNKSVLATVVILAAVGLLFYGYTKLSSLPRKLLPPTYSSSLYGIGFTYPDTYALQEKELGNGEPWHHGIVLVDKEWLKDMPDSGEGPAAIAVDIYQNDLEALPIENWIHETSASNYKLSTDERPALIQIGGAQAYFYHWDGLYKGQSYVLAHKGNVVVFSATYNDESDQILKDFADVLASVSLR